MAERLLVTGGAGFIGSHLVEALIERGYRVRVLDNLSLGKREWVHPEAEFVLGDIRDLDACIAACDGCRGVFHLAAMSRSAASLDAVGVCTANNIVGTQNVLEAARSAGVRKVIYSGSSTYYGDRPAPHVESLPPRFLNFYGLSKYAGEEYCLLFDRLYGVPAVVLRYFNVYGPRLSGEGPYALVLSVFLRQAAAGEPLTLHGDGAQSRDFVHVRDVAAANVRAWESPVHGAAYNVGTGSSVSIRKVADLISPDQVFMPRRVADAEVTLADITRIRRDLGWEPSIPFEQGLAELLANSSGTARETNGCR